jgi:hypothetical protein
MAYIGRTTDGFGVRQRFLFTPDAGATSVSGTDANGATLTFSDSVYMDVFLNGVLLKAGTDYNTNTANTIAGLTATVANDEVTVLVYDIFTTADMVSATSGGTFSGKVTMQSDGNTEQLKLVSTDADASEGPLAILHRNSSSPADGDSLGRIYFSGENDAGEEIQYVRFQSILSDASDGTEDSAFRIQSYVGGNIRSRLLIDPTETVFNEDSADVDFRVESNGDANMLFVEGETNMIGIKTNDPKEVLDVRGPIVASGDHATNSNAQGSAHGVMLSSTSGTGLVSPISNGANDVDLTLRGLNGGSFENRLVLDSDGDVTVSAGNLVIGTSGKGIDFSATSHAGGVDSELFDDYEEGTFSVSATIASGALAISGSYNLLSYTKVGHRVFISGGIRLASANASGSPSGAVNLDDLPFTPASASEDEIHSCFFVAHDSMTGMSAQPMIGQILPGNTNIFLFTQDASGFADPGNHFTDNSILRFNFSYIAA